MFYFGSFQKFSSPLNAILPQFFKEKEWRETSNCFIQYKEIFPLDRVIHPLNNWSQACNKKITITYLYN